MIVLVGVVAIVGGCSRSASNGQKPKPVDEVDEKPAPETVGTAAHEPGAERVATSDEDRAVLTSLEAKIRERDPSTDVVTEETVERYGQKLTQYRMGSRSFRAAR